VKKHSAVAKARSFGLSVGGVLIAIALALVWRGRMGRAEIVGGIGVVLVTAGYFRPMLIRIPSDAWWAFATVLGWVNARVLLSLAFFVVLTPIGMVWRLMRRDPMARRQADYAGWMEYPARYRDKKHFDRMY
jgi:Saxitoxin biosynthesis operon protein SxtJ